MRALVVEDDPVSARLIEQALKGENMVSEPANCGEDGIELAKLYDFDIIILDLRLPDIDGYEVARRVRANAALASVVLVALTGYGQREDRERAFAAGFDHHFVKPVDPDELNAFLVRCRSARDAAATDAAPAVSPLAPAS